jgi:hypothetical protein
LFRSNLEYKKYGSIFLHRRVLQLCFNCYMYVKIKTFIYLELKIKLNLVLEQEEVVQKSFKCTRLRLNNYYNYKKFLYIFLIIFIIIKNALFESLTCYVFFLCVLCGIFWIICVITTLLCLIRGKVAKNIILCGINLFLCVIPF